MSYAAGGAGLHKDRNDNKKGAGRMPGAFEVPAGQSVRFT